MTRIYLPAVALKLVSPHMGRDESRPSIQRIVLESTGVIVATTGTTLGAYDTANELDDANTPDGFVRAPSEDIAFRLHNARGKFPTARKVEFYSIDLPADWGNQGNTFGATLTAWGRLGPAAQDIVSVTPILATRLKSDPFPKWRQVVPSFTSEPTQLATAVAYGAAQVTTFLDAISSVAGDTEDAFTLAWESDKPSWRERAAVVRYPHFRRFLGVLMPRRIADDFADAPRHIPGWARQRCEVTA